MVMAAAVCIPRLSTHFFARHKEPAIQSIGKEWHEPCNFTLRNFSSHIAPAIRHYYDTFILILFTLSAIKRKIVLLRVDHTLSNAHICKQSIRLRYLNDLAIF